MNADTDRLIAQARATTPPGSFAWQLADALAAAEAALVTEAGDRCRAEQGWADEAARAEAAKAQRDTLARAMSQIKLIQPLTLKMLRKHGVVFDGPLGTDPKNFQHVAFSIYSNLCEVDSIARAALAGVAPPEEQP